MSTQVIDSLSPSSPYQTLSQEKSYPSSTDLIEIQSLESPQAFQSPQETLKSTHNDDSFDSCLDDSLSSDNEIEIKEINGIDNESYSRIEKILSAISKILIQLISRNKSNKNYYSKNNNKNISKFICLNKPEISIYDYLLRIHKYTQFDEGTIIYALIYIDKISKKRIVINEYNIHKILFISILIAIKFNEDNIYKNTYYSQVAGINIFDINSMEYEFLSLIDFSCFVKQDLFDKYRENLLRYE